MDVFQPRKPPLLEEDFLKFLVRKNLTTAKCVLHFFRRRKSRTSPANTCGERLSQAVGS
jgi:hypothetical protein